MYKRIVCIDAIHMCLKGRMDGHQNCVIMLLTCTSMFLGNTASVQYNNIYTMMH